MVSFLTLEFKLIHQRLIYEVPWWPALYLGEGIQG